MPQPPTLTPEQRKAALDKAARARKERAELKDHLKTGRVSLQELLGKADSDEIVVLAIPLLTAAHRDTVKLHKVVVVDCPTDVALERLLSQRGFDRADAEARIKSQVSREERLKEADYVVDNSGDRSALLGEVATLWDWLLAAAAEQRAHA